jgi:hypothetical protein
MNQTPIHLEIIDILQKSSKESPYLNAVMREIIKSDDMDNVARMLTSALINVDTHLNKTTQELIKARQNSLHIPPVLLDKNQIFMGVDIGVGDVGVYHDAHGSALSDMKETTTEP